MWNLLPSAMRRQKAQSAMEYLMTYGWAILIIAIVLAALFSLGVFSSSSFIGTSCIAASGFLCSNPILNGFELTAALGQYSGTNWNSAIFCIVPSGFAAPNSLGCPSGYPQISAGSFTNGQHGSYTFSSTPTYSFPSFGSVFSGQIWAVYTIPQYSGNLIVQLATITAKNVGASSSNPSSAYYAPISLDNAQTAATPTPFQQMVTFNPLTYAQYENSNLGNIRFFQGSAELYSWCESGCSSTASQALFWVKMPNGIGASTVANINMTFEPASTNYDGSYAGEAPQLSSTYGQYDNGASVFNFYDNFAGTTLSSKWIANGAAYSVSNGLTYKTNNNWATLLSATSFTAPYIIDYYGYGTASSSDAGIYFDVQGTAANENTTLWAQRGASADAYYTYISGTYTSEAAWAYSIDGNFHVYTLIDGISNNPLITQTDYSTKWDFTTFPSTYTSGYFGPRQIAAGDILFWQWVRTRAYPPNGVMPSVTFGSVA